MTIFSILREPRTRIACGFVLGATMGGLTLMIEHLALVSDNPILGFLQTVLFVLILPGMISAMLFRQNVHAWHQSVAALMNALLYFAIAWLVLRIFARRAGVREIP
jgi:hypothetical protein